MTILTSVQNETIKTIVKLHCAKERKKQQAFVVEGFRAVSGFIEHGYTPLQLFKREHAPELNVSCQVTVVSDAVMQKMSSTTTPSNVLAVFKLPLNPAPEKLSSGLVLANITDPGNMGTLIRSCAAFGYSTVVVVDGCDPFSPKVIQATAGSLPLVNLFRWSWEKLLENKKDLSLCALVIKDGKSFKDIDLNNLLFVVGNEAHGLKEEWLTTCDSFLTLPMPGKTESLNAAIAGSIALALKSLKT